ncbi:MAG TPA: hypothetical protein VKD90_19175 [Gemmataceae bacterium]|nr:hypothetical protein [Gemmataceae bacterium]
MRTCPWAFLILGIATPVGAAGVLGGQDKEVATDMVTGLIRQLGHRCFAKREAASRELATIGEPARAALTNATADPDPEVGRRARQVLDGLDARALAAAARKELARWEGEWTGNGGQKFVVKGDRWAWGQAGSWTLDEQKGDLVLIVAVGEKLIHADMLVGDPANGGRVCRAIFRLHGDTLHYCGTYDPFRPTEFRTTINTFYVAWTRVKK